MQMTFESSYKQTKHIFILLCLLDMGYQYLLTRFRHSFRYPSDISNRLTCITHIIFTVCYSVRNMLNEPWNKEPTYHSQFIIHSMIAYFLYDLLVLFSTERGRKQTVFLIHHAVSLLFLFTNRIQPSGDNIMFNSVTFLLESPTPLLNTMKIIEELIPNSYFYVAFYISTTLYYGLSRILLFVPYIVMYVQHYFTLKWNHVITLSTFLLLLYASTKWFIMMIHKKV